MLVTVGGVAARGYYNHSDAFLSKVSAGNNVASPALTDKQGKSHFDFKSAGIISEYKRCDWTRVQLNKAELGVGDKHFKCEELETYVEPAERLKAASRQDLVQNCEQGQASVAVHVSNGDTLRRRPLVSELLKSGM